MRWQPGHGGHEWKQDSEIVVDESLQVLSCLCRPVYALSPPTCESRVAFPAALEVAGVALMRESCTDLRRSSLQESRCSVRPLSSHDSSRSNRVSAASGNNCGSQLLLTALVELLRRLRSPAGWIAATLAREGGLDHAKKAGGNWMRAK